MPVLIAAGTTELDLVRPLAFRLLEDGGEVRCYLEEDDHELRQEGCKVAVGEMTDDVTLEGALTNVHTFIPLITDPVLIRGENDLGFLEAFGHAAASAAGRSQIEQTILAIPALSEASRLGSAYRGIGERFREAVRPLCLITTGMVWGLERPFRGVVAGLERGQEVEVVPVEELVEALSKADDRENLDGNWGLAGQRLTAGDLASGVVGEPEQRDPPALLSQSLALGMAVGNSAYGALGVARHPILK